GRRSLRTAHRRRRAVADLDVRAFPGTEFDDEFYSVFGQTHFMSLAIDRRLRGFRRVELLPQKLIVLTPAGFIRQPEPVTIEAHIRSSVLTCLLPTGSAARLNRTQPRQPWFAGIQTLHRPK